MGLKCNKHKKMTNNYLKTHTNAFNSLKEKVAKNEDDFYERDFYFIIEQLDNDINNLFNIA